MPPLTAELLLHLKMPKPKPTFHKSIEAFEGNAGEKKRAVYILVFLQTADTKLASRVSGLSRLSHSRIINMFRERGNALDAPRSGRPLAYTDAVMQEAMATLVGHRGVMNGPELHQQMIEKGVVHPSADRQRFLSGLRKHVREEGFQLIANCTKTVFYISQQDERDRLAFAKEVLALLRHELSLKSIWWIDETSIDEDPHPKGKRNLCT